MKFLIFLLFARLTPFLLADDGSLADNHNVTTWIYPPPTTNSTDFSGLYINYGDTIIIQWRSTFAASDDGTLHLQLWCGSTRLNPWNTRVSANGTCPLKFADLGLNNWPLPQTCMLSFGDDVLGVNSPNFVVDSEDPNLSATTWSVSTSSTAVATSPTVTSTSSSSQLTPPAVITASIPSSTSTPPSTVVSQPAPRHQTSIAIGSTVAGLAALALLSLAVWFQRRRREQRRREHLKATEDEKDGDTSNLDSAYSKPELAANCHPPQEMPLALNTESALPPYELPPEQRSYQELPGKVTAQSVYEMPVSTTPQLSSSRRPIRGAWNFF